MLLVEAIHRPLRLGMLGLQRQAQCSAESSLPCCERDHLVWAAVNDRTTVLRANLALQLRQPPFFLDITLRIYKISRNIYSLI
jgi:hypothetical protein